MKNVGLCFADVFRGSWFGFAGAGVGADVDDVAGAGVSAVIVND